MIDKKKWKEFEKSSHKIIQNLNPQAKVLKNVFIKGTLSKIPRQIDVQLVNPEQYDFIAFECKDFKRVLDISFVEEFSTKLRDIGAKKGAIVSNSPFSQAAKNMAEELGIDLLNLIDTSNKNIRGKLFARILFSDIMITRFKVALTISAPTTATFRQEPTEILLVDEKGDKGTAYEIFAHLWNEENSSLSRVPGVYEYIPPNQNLKNIVSLEGKIVPLGKLSFIYEVVEKYYSGEIELINAQGLYNVRERSFQTRSITTQMIYPYEFEKVENELTEYQVGEAKGDFLLETRVISVLPEKH